MSISDAFLGGQQQRNESHLENLVEVALSDGKIVEEERQLLEKFAKRLSISTADLDDIIKNIGKHPINPPVNREDRYKRFFRLIQMMLSDGIIGEKQDILIHKFAIGLGYSEERTEELYQQTIDLVKNKIDFEEAFEKVTH
ncbi:MAG: TerB family tellurite resistance protein [Flavobacteriales bacterium]